MKKKTVDKEKNTKIEKKQLKHLKKLEKESRQ